MAFGDPSSQFFAYDAPSGERLVCLLDDAMDGRTRGFSVLSHDIDAPERGRWHPTTEMLVLDGATDAVFVGASNVETGRSVCIDMDTRKVTISDGMGCAEGGVHLYPGYFDAVPAGGRIADILATPDVEDGPEPDDEIDWADHHVAETRALARAYAAF